MSACAPAVSAEQSVAPLAWRRGQCHCGAVRFEFRSALAGAVECNCSYCLRKAALHHRVPPEHFRLLSGHEFMALYQFGTMRAHHHFCSRCGVHTHCHPRSAPEQVNVNLRCMDDIETVLQSMAIKHFDGRSWAS